MTGRGTETADRSVSRFACTSCGKCCDRSPEVQLCEAAALADVFVFQLMFRLYSLPRALPDYLRLRPGQPDAAGQFYEKKRLLSAHAARRSDATLSRGGRAVDHVQYLVISALPVDTGTGACSALDGGRCSIYERRPLGCRTVPFHYSRVEAAAKSDLATFVAKPGHGCDTSEAAPVILEEGRIADPAINRARADALALAGEEKPWTDAILRRMKAPALARYPLPSLGEIQANAAFGATTVPMALAWRIAAEAGLIGTDRYAGLIEAQLSAIDRLLATPSCAIEARGTLARMRSDYLARRASVSDRA